MAAIGNLFNLNNLKLGLFNQNNNSIKQNSGTKENDSIFPASNSLSKFNPFDKSTETDFTFDEYLFSQEDSDNNGQNTFAGLNALLASDKFDFDVPNGLSEKDFELYNNLDKNQFE